MTVMEAVSILHHHFIDEAFKLFIVVFSAIKLAIIAEI